MATTDYRALVEALSRAGVDYVIVGGTAAVLHGSATATYDLHILMQFSLTNCERLLGALRPLQPRYAHLPAKPPLALSPIELTKLENLYLQLTLGRLDVLGSLPPLTDVDAIFAQAEVLDLGGFEVKVLNLTHLLAVKSAMTRPKDKLVEAELRALEAVRTRRGS